MSYKSEILELFRDNWECEDYYPLIHTLRDLPTMQLRRAYMEKFVAEIEKDALLIKHTHSEGGPMSTHVIKMRYDNGVKLPAPTLWCGRKGSVLEYYFMDAGHLSLSIGGSIQPCKKCVKAIIKELSKEL